jgi:hypothetical protein
MEDLTVGHGTIAVLVPGRPPIEAMNEKATGYRTLVEAFERCAARARRESLSLGEVLDTIGEASYSLICIVLTLPFLQPISLGPLATVGGLSFAALGWQWLRGHASPMLPQRLRAAELNAKTWDILLGVCMKILRFCQRFTRPRLQAWVSGERGRLLAGWIIILSGLLMAVPFFGLPFNNLLPALAILFVCIGELEDDGLMVFISLGWLIATVVYFVFILGLLWFLGERALTYFR